MRVANTADAAGITKVFQSNLGDTYTSEADIRELIESPAWVIYVVDNDENEIIAAASGNKISDTDGLQPYLLDHWRGVVENISSSGPILMIKSVAVDSAYTGRGFASDLVRHLIQWGRHKDCTAVFSIGWTDHNGCHIEPVFNRLSLHPLMDIESFWTKDSLEQGYSCPTCGNPCNCTARLFFSGMSAPGRSPILFPS